MEGKKLELAPDAVFAVTVQSNDITKPESVQSSYSNTLSAPFTEHNHQVLENAADVNSQTLMPYRKLSASVLSDGVEVVPLPKVFVSEAREGYELQVFSGALDLFAKLGDKSIRDLDLSRFNHIWNVANVVAGADANRTYLDGYIYSPVENGKPGWWAEDMHPSVFVRTVFEQMLTEAGVSYTGIDDELWDRLILPFSNDKPEHNTAWLWANQYYSYTELEPVWPVTNYGILKAVATASMSRISGSIMPELWIQLRRDGVEVESHRMEMTSLGEHRLEASFRIEPYEDLSKLDIRIQAINWSANMADQSTGAFTRIYSYDEEVYFKTEWDVALNLPDIKQKDFFKAIRSLFDLMVSFDPYSNSLTLTPFNKLQVRRPQALDWSHKLVYVEQERVSVQYRFGAFAQRSWWRYKQDELGGNGDHYLSIDDEQLEAEKNVVELPFAASSEQGAVLDIPLFARQPEKDQSFTKTTGTIASRNSNSFDDGDTVLVKDATADPFVKEGWAIYERVEDRFNSSNGWVIRQQQGHFYIRNKVAPRIAVLREESMSFAINESRTNKAEVMGRGAAFTPISFMSLLATRYLALQGVLEKTKGITPYFLLTAADVANYDPSVPIWLDQFQEYFYLNSINEFTEEGPTECQLWRL